MDTNVKKKVKQFFAGSKYVYATPGTTNYNANFYGDTTICRLCQRDVIGCIDSAGDWGDMTLDERIETVLDDLQYDKPVNN